MKKIGIIITVIAMFLCTSNTYAQFRIGAKAGLNISNAKVKGASDTKSKLGIHLGGVAEYEIMDMLYAQGGLLLSQKGYKYEDEAFGYSYDIKASLFYLDIPLTAMYKYEMGDLSIYGKGGFNIGMGLSGKYKYEETVDGDTESDEESVDWGTGVSNDLKRMELGFIIGAGVEINESMQIGLSYNIGLNDISTVSSGEYKNRVFAISFTYFLAEL